MKQKHIKFEFNFKKRADPKFKHPWILKKYVLTTFFILYIFFSMSLTPPTTPNQKLKLIPNPQFLLVKKLLPTMIKLIWQIIWIETSFHWLVRGISSKKTMNIRLKH